MYNASQGEIGQHEDRMCLEVGVKFLSYTQRANATCSRQVYRVFALDRDLLMKNIGLCFRFSSSLNRVALTEAFDTAR